MIDAKKFSKKGSAILRPAIRGLFTAVYEAGATPQEALQAVPTLLAGALLHELARDNEGVADVIALRLCQSLVTSVVDAAANVRSISEAGKKLKTLQ